MKIAMLASCFLPVIGGAEVVVHNLAVHLQRMGHEVFVITWWGNWRRIWGRLPYRVLPLLPRSYTESDRAKLESTGQIRRGIGRQIRFYHWLCSFDVMNVHLAHPMMGPLSVKGQSKSLPPFVMTCHGGDLLYDETIRYGARRHPVLRRLVEENILACDQVTANSALMYDQYTQVGVPPEGIARIPSGVDVQRIVNMQVNKVRWREEHDIHKNCFLCLTVGRNARCKGSQLIPKILFRLLKKGIDCCWVVVGEESDKILDLPEAQAIRSKLYCYSSVNPGNQTENVLYLPPGEIVKWYKSSDLYVHPALLESFGNVIIEAMAAGLPVVATDRTGASECVEKAQCGLVAKTGDVEDIADKITQLAKNEPLRAEMSKRAVQASMEYDWPVIARKYLDVYERLVSLS